MYKTFRAASSLPLLVSFYISPNTKVDSNVCVYINVQNANASNRKNTQKNKEEVNIQTLSYSLTTSSSQGFELNPQFPPMLDASASMCQTYQTMLWLLLLWWDPSPDINRQFCDPSKRCLPKTLGRGPEVVKIHSDMKELELQGMNTAFWPAMKRVRLCVFRWQGVVV